MAIHVPEPPVGFCHLGWFLWGGTEFLVNLMRRWCKRKLYLSRFGAVSCFGTMKAKLVALLGPLALPKLP
jgi:hypothetical protein